MSVEYPYYDEVQKKWYRLEYCGKIKIKDYEPVLLTSCGLYIGANKLERERDNDDKREES